MLDKADLVRLFEYTVWANHKVLRQAATLSVDDFKRDLKSSHGGVRGTLVHAMSAEWVWLERWKGVSPRRHIDESEFPTIVSLSDRWTALDQHRASWLASVRPEAAAQEVRFQNFKGQDYATPLWQLCQHVANHSTYHRGRRSRCCASWARRASRPTWRLGPRAAEPRLTRYRARSLR
jgi:uncharacterized damage-inducible protein DinB